MRITVFETHHPGHNLTLEKNFFDQFQAHEEEHLLLWRNTTCVIIGRFQEVEDEMDLSLGIPHYRRISGGGAVYQDLGNLNFSFLVAKKNFHKEFYLDLLRDFILKRYGIFLERNSRGDLLHQGKKLSGNAARILSDKVLFHFTLLVESNLEQLRKVLRLGQEVKIKGKGVPSVRTEVTQLSEINPSLNLTQFCKDLMSDWSGQELYSSQQNF